MLHILQLFYMHTFEVKQDCPRHILAQDRSRYECHMSTDRKFTGNCSLTIQKRLAKLQKFNSGRQLV